MRKHEGLQYYFVTYPVYSVYVLVHRSTKINRAYSSVCVDLCKQVYVPVQLSQMCVTGTRPDVRCARLGTGSWACAARPRARLCVKNTAGCTLGAHLEGEREVVKQHTSNDA